MARFATASVRRDAHRDGSDDDARRDRYAGGAGSSRAGANEEEDREHRSQHRRPSEEREATRIEGYRPAGADENDERRPHRAPGREEQAR